MVEADHPHPLQSTRLRCWQACGDRMERASSRITPYDPAAIRCGPEPSGRIQLDFGDKIVGQAAWVGTIVTQVLKRVAVIAVDPVFGAEPHKSRRILSDGVDGLLRQAVVHSEAIEAHGSRSCGQ